ncbi:MAG: transcription terminating nucleic-acid-binding protein [Nocardioides sp.]|nr:transcription terminating nucleic-acid-binding protein [Nocardioides sp.]
MRNPSNDGRGLTDSNGTPPLPPARKGHRGKRPAPGGKRPAADGPVRTCILSRDESPREGLIRLALSPEGEVLPDVRAKAPGRGAWIGVTRAELEAAQAKGKLKGALARAFKTATMTVPDDLGARIETALERNALDRLGLESRAGHLLTGSERIETAARQGKLRALYHAADAGSDGSGKLAQAWRVGSEREGSGLRGLALPVPRTILSLALGRENVVHAGLTDAQAARRVSEALDRWLHFIGPDRVSAPCEKQSQGASALEASDAAEDEKNEGNK